MIFFLEERIVVLLFVNSDTGDGAENSIRIHEFTRQDATIPIDKVGRPDGDMSREFTESRTRNMEGLEELMDSLELQIEYYNNKNNMQFLQEYL